MKTMTTDRHTKMGRGLAEAFANGAAVHLNGEFYKVEKIEQSSYVDGGKEHPLIVAYLIPHPPSS